MPQLISSQLTILALIPPLLPPLPHPPYYSGDKKEKSPNPDPVDSTQLSRRLISYIAGILECSLIGEDATVRRHPRLLHLRSRSDQVRAPDLLTGRRGLASRAVFQQLLVGLDRFHLITQTASDASVFIQQVSIPSSPPRMSHAPPLVCLLCVD